jgi:hypothetical protein
VQGGEARGAMHLARVHALPLRRKSALWDGAVSVRVSRTRPR